LCKEESQAEMCADCEVLWSANRGLRAAAGKSAKMKKKHLSVIQTERLS